MVKGHASHECVVHAWGRVRGEVVCEQYGAYMGACMRCVWGEAGCMERQWASGRLQPVMQSCSPEVSSHEVMGHGPRLTSMFSSRTSFSLARSSSVPLLITISCREQLG